MEIEKGTVQKIEEGWAWVETRRTGSYESCSQKRHCLKLGEGNDRMLVKADNVAQARNRDDVEINLKTKTKLKCLFMIYVFPVIGLLIGALSGKSLSTLIGLNGDLVIVLASFCGMAIAFFVARFLGFRMKENNDLITIVSRIIRRMHAGTPAPQIQ